MNPSEGVREIEKEADGIVQQWHYRHYEDYIPSKKTIEGAMYGELSLRIAFALTQAEKRGFDRAREEAAKVSEDFGDTAKGIAIAGERIAKAIRNLTYEGAKDDGE